MRFYLFVSVSVEYSLLIQQTIYFVERFIQIINKSIVFEQQRKFKFEKLLCQYEKFF